MGRLTPFVGRGEALQVLDEALRAAPLGGLSGVVVAGPAGIGKSRLVAEFLANAPAVGVRASGSCAVDDHYFAPLRPIHEVLADLAADDVLHAGTTSQEQGHRFQQVAEVLRGAARGSGLLTLVLEDLHWADTTSLQLLRFLVRALSNEPILLVVTHRDGHEVGPSLRDLLTALDRDPNAHRVALAPLARSEVAAMAEHRLGHRLDEAATDRLAARSEGVPLFVEELLETKDRTDEIPGPVQDLFLVQLEHLSADARSVVEHAAVCGSEFRYELLAEVTEADPQALEAGLDELFAAGILVAAAAGADYRFRHALLHETLYRQLRPPARRRLHRRCAQVLTGHPHLASPSRSLAAALGDHWREAGEPLPALRNLLEAADEACEMRAYAEALQHELVACDIAEQVPPDRRDGLSTSHLRARAAYTAGRAGDHHQEVALLESTLEEADDPVVRSALSVQLAAARYLAGDAVGAASTAYATLESLPPEAPDEARALLLAVSAHLRRDATGRSTPLEATSEALELARRTGSAEVLCSVLCAHGLAQATTGDVAGARGSLDEAEGLTNEVTDPRTAMRPSVYRMLLLQRLGASREVVHLGREAITRADRLGVGRGSGQQLRAILADALVALGLWDEASTVIDDALAWGDQGLPGAFLLLARAELATRRGAFAVAERELTTVQERSHTGHPRTSLVAAELAWWRRDPVGSRYHASRGLEVAAVGGPDELGALTYTLARAVTASSSGATEQDRRRLDATLDALTATADNPVVGAWRASALAELADGHDRPRAWEEAHSAWRATNHVPMLAHTSWNAARAHLAAGDRVTAHPRLEEAHELAERLGARPMLVEIRAALGAVGGRPEAAGPPVAGADTVGSEAQRFGLTRRELEVLDLLSRGWPNKRIGAALSVSPRTVGTHVSHILNKLGVETRGEAVALVFRSPPVEGPDRASSVR